MGKENELIKYLVISERQMKTRQFLPRSAARNINSLQSQRLHSPGHQNLYRANERGIHQLLHIVANEMYPMNVAILVHKYKHLWIHIAQGLACLHVSRNMW